MFLFTGVLLTAPWLLCSGFDLPRLLAVTGPHVLDYAGTALTLGLNHAGTLLTGVLVNYTALLTKSVSSRLVMIRRSPMLTDAYAYTAYILSYYHPSSLLLLFSSSPSYCYLYSRYSLLLLLVLLVPLGSLITILLLLILSALPLGLVVFSCSAGVTRHLLMMVPVLMDMGLLLFVR